LSNLCLPWKQSVSWTFPCIDYTFYHSGVLSNLHLPWKQNCPCILHCIEIFFIIQDFLATCACTENRVCPENFQARVGGRPPPSPRLVCLRVKYSITAHKVLSQTSKVSQRKLTNPINIMMRFENCTWRCVLQMKSFQYLSRSYLLIHVTMLAHRLSTAKPRMCCLQSYVVFLFKFFSSSQSKMIRLLAFRRT